MSYESVIVGDTPVTYWRLDEPSGTVANDFSGNGVNGTIHGAVTLGDASPIRSDPASQAMTFDGTADNQYIKSVANFGGFVRATFVLECWFKIPAAHAADSAGLIAGMFRDSGSAGLWIARAPENVPGLATVLCNWTGSGIAGSGIGINANPDIWYYCNVGFDGTTAWFFYAGTNGAGGSASIATVSSGVDLTSGAAHLFAGGTDLGVGDGFFGSVDEVAFFEGSPPVATFDANDPIFGPNGTHFRAAGDDPIVDTVTPDSGSTVGGTAVVITGTSLTPASDVLFGDVPAASFVDDASGTTITAVSPPHDEGTVDVTVVLETSF